MNLSYSLPKRNNPMNIRLLVAFTVLALLALTMTLSGVISRGAKENFAPVQGVSAIAFSAGPQTLPVPTPSQSNWQHVISQKSATPSPVDFEPSAQPVATPPAGK